MAIFLHIETGDTGYYSCTKINVKKLTMNFYPSLFKVFFNEKLLAVNCSVYSLLEKKMIRKGK